MCGAIVPVEKKENCNHITSFHRYTELLLWRERGAAPLFKSEKPKSVVRRIWLGLFADKGVRPQFETVAAVACNNVIDMNWMLDRNCIYGRVAFVTGIAVIVI